MDNQRYTELIYVLKWHNLSALPKILIPAILILHASGFYLGSLLEQTDQFLYLRCSPEVIFSKDFNLNVVQTRWHQGWVFPPFIVPSTISIDSWLSRPVLSNMPTILAAVGWPWLETRCPPVPICHSSSQLDRGDNITKGLSLQQPQHNPYMTADIFQQEKYKLKTYALNLQDTRHSQWQPGLNITHGYR